jgi:hypothetical protein
MKIILSPNQIVSQYINSLLIIEQSNLTGEYKIGNKEGKKIIKLFKILERNINLAKEVLPLLFEHTSVKVKICAAAHCLALKIYENKAVTILENISTMNTRIFSFEAEMTLKVWREQGYLKIYQK